MLDDIQRLGGEVARQSRTPGSGTRGYASSAGGSARGGGVPTPTSFVNDAGLGVRAFIPGRDPLYDPDSPPPYEYVLGVD